MTLLGVVKPIDRGTSATASETSARSASGQIRLRVRFRDVIGPWMDYPMVSPEELEGILRGTGWQLETTLDSDDTYIAVIGRR